MRLFAFLCWLFIGVGVSEAQLFTDDFSRGTDPGPLSPWTARSGSWTVTGGALRAGANALDSFGFLYVTNSWTNYSVQARVRFSTVNADAGGIGGRLNPFSGSHYAAWISPEGSTHPSTLLLAKFQYWEAYEYTNTPPTNNLWQPMQRVALPSVGTNWHTLKLLFQGNQISVYYDSNLVTSVTDVESNPYLTGGIIAGISTSTSAYNMFLDDVTVSPAPTLLAAVNDNYSVAQNGSLNVAAPGVLSNDMPGTLTNLSAIRVGNPTRGTLTLNSNGGFSYVPSNNFVGIDSFTYLVSDGVSNSTWATVTVDVLPSTNVFYDNFTRSGASNAFAPWVVGLGQWGINNGVMLGAGTLNDYYSDAYIPGVWTDFSVQTRFQLPSGAWACGVSGRLNPLTGERYVANVYPETSPYKPTPSIRLIKFHSWGTWSDTFTAMAQASVASVGTSFHTLKMACYGNTIDVYYDGALVIHAVDNLTDGIPFYRSGAFGAHMYMYTPYQATFDDYNVSLLPGINYPPVLPAQANRNLAPQATLLVTNTATDPDGPANTLAYTLQNPPSGATIDTNGVISWTPSPAQDPSTNLFTTVVTDFYPSATNAQHLSATNSFTVVVNSRAAVALDSTALLAEGCAPANNAIDSGEIVTMSFAFKNTGFANTTNLVATLLPGNGVASPSGPQAYGGLIAGGAPVGQPFTFAATGACGSTINATFQMQDGPLNLGTVAVPLPLGQFSTMFTQTFDTVTAPALPSGWTTSATGVESNWVTQTSASSSPPNSAFVPDVANIGASDLVSPAIVLPLGASQLSFVNSYDLETNVNNPGEGFDGGVLEIKIGTNAFADILAAGGSFVANGYTLPISAAWGNPLGGRQAWSGNSGGFLNTIVALPAAAAGQTVQLRWRIGTDNSNGRPGWRIDSVGIIGRACCINAGPTLAAQANRTIGEMTTLVVTNTATDPSTPPSGLTYTLANPPANAAIDTNGIITFTPSEAQGPGTNTITTIVSDNAFPPLTATNSFTVVINELNRPPILPFQTNQTITGLATLVVTNIATDPDLPANDLAYVLVSGPTNAVIDTNGVIIWTPIPGQVPSTNSITTIVTDSNPWAVNSQHLSATNSFTVIVNAIHNGPFLPTPTNYMVDEWATLLVTNTASDGDLPALTLYYSLLDPPAGAAIDTNGIITWIPSEAQGPSTNTITTIVTDNGTPPLSSTNSFTVFVNEVNEPPTLPIQTNRTITGLNTLVVINTASDPDVPTNNLAYVLVSGPTNAVIDTNGVITWTPVVEQVPSTNSITTIVTDSNPWAVNSQHLSATNTFTVIVNAIHNGPSLGSQTNRTLIEPAALIVTNSAIDNDIPVPALTYLLVNPPPGASISTNGVISWSPLSAQAPSTNLFQTVVMDDPGGSGLSATNSFLVIVEPQPIVPAPVIQSLVISNEAAVLVWTAVPGQTYRLQYKDQFDDTNWTDLLPDLLATDSTLTTTNQLGASAQKFYRIFLVP